MELNEWKQCVAVLKCAYTRKEFLPDKEAALIWFNFLSDIPYKLVQEAISSYVKTEHFEPSIADLRRKAFEIEHGSFDGLEMKAWESVNRAMVDAIYHQREAFERLDPVVQQCIGSSSVLREWAMTECSSMPVIQSQFLKSYRARIADAKNQCIMSTGFSDSVALLGTRTDKTEFIEDKKEAGSYDFVQAPADLIEQLRRNLGAK